MEVQTQKKTTKEVIEKGIEKLTHKKSQKKQGEEVADIEWYYQILDSPTFRGGVLGALITGFVSWNTGHNGRIGKFLKHWNFVRHFISPKTYNQFCPITDYHHTDLDIAANNFYCYSGQSGIGKSRHFQQLVADQSHIRPTLYVSFKAVGRKANFQNDLAQQLSYGQAATVRGGIVGQIVRAIKQIQFINQNAERYRWKYYLTNMLITATYAGILMSPLLMQFKIAMLGPIFLAHIQYLRFMQPLIRQSIRRTIPVIVFDDVNKLDHLGMLAQITRFFKVLQAKSANLMMISSNQQTWSKLRRQPGMKDRLRVRQLKYNHEQTSKQLVDLIAKKPELITNYFTFHPLFTTEIIKELAKVFIGVKQMSIRRFTSVLKLVDEEEYQKLVQILKSVHTHQKTPVEAVQAMRDIVFETQVHTMVANFRSIKRQLPKMSVPTFIATLKAVTKHSKLPSDNKVGALLKIYNIMRDMRSQYVINGGYMLKIFQMAIEQYKTQMEQYDLPQYKQHDFSS